MMYKMIVRNKITGVVAEFEGYAASKENLIKSADAHGYEVLDIKENE